MIRPTDTAAVSRTSWRSCPVPESSESVGDTLAIEPHLLGHGLHPVRVVVVGDEHDPIVGPSASRKRAAGHRDESHVPVPWFFEQEGVDGNALVEEVAVAVLFGHAVGGLLPPGQHDERCEAGFVELGGVVERSCSTGEGVPSYCAAPSTRMASAGRAPSRVGGPVDLHERHRPVQHDRHEQGQHGPGHPPTPGSAGAQSGGGPRPTPTAIARRRGRRRPRRRRASGVTPSDARDSNSGGRPPGRSWRPGREPAPCSAAARLRR